MTDEIRRLLLNPPTGDGYVHVDDGPSDSAMALFGLTGTYLDVHLVDRIVGLALAPDLAWARDVFDSRITPRESGRRTSFGIYVDPNGGTGGSSDVKSFSEGHGDTPVTLTRPTHPDRTFSGWRLSSPRLVVEWEIRAPGLVHDPSTGAISGQNVTYDPETGTIALPESRFEFDTFIIPDGFSEDIIVQAEWQ